MNLSDITPMILTYNEAPNLRATLDGLSWATRVVIIDSGSTDQTLAISSEFPQVTVYQRPFDNHTNQWNHGLDQIETRWALTLDADYVCPSELAAELGQLTPANEVYFARFHYCVWGHRLRGSLYPPRAVLFAAATYRYVPDGHTQRLDVSGAETGFLESIVRHDDRKPLSHWCATQVKYAQLEAAKLCSSERHSLGSKDRIRRRMIFAPVLTLFYCLFAKRLILDGWPGIFYSLQRTYAELVLSLILLDRKIRGV